MEGNLVLIFEEKKSTLLFGQEGIVLAEEKCPSAVYPENLKTFLCHNGIIPAEVKRVLVVADLTALLFNTESALGYFRLTSAPLELAPIKELLKRKNLKLYTFQLPLPGQPGYRSQLEKALSYLAELPVKNIAVNSAFSPIDPSPEQELIETAEKIFPGRFSFYPSCLYNALNFFFRENVLLINCICQSKN